MQDIKYRHQSLHCILQITLITDAFSLVDTISPVRSFFLTIMHPGVLTCVPFYNILVYTQVCLLVKPLCHPVSNCYASCYNILVYTLVCPLVMYLVCQLACHKVLFLHFLLVCFTLIVDLII
jgi:hypothetical protein